jgi:hypothetical protein
MFPNKMRKVNFEIAGLVDLLTMRVQAGKPGTRAPIGAGPVCWFRELAHD